MPMVVAASFTAVRSGFDVVLSPAPSPLSDLLNYVLRDTPQKANSSSYLATNRLRSAGWALGGNRAPIRA